MAALLDVQSIEAGYGRVAAIKGVSLTASAGKLTALLGANGAGKTTTMLSISGLLAVRAGRIEMEGRVVSNLANDAIVRGGVVQAPQGRQVFPRMTVRENLDLGGFLSPARQTRAAVEEVLDDFPRLRERQSQMAGTLSGGEQQMLAIGRALIARPRVLLLDEPSLGLAPVIVDAVYEIVAKLLARGLGIVLAEQNVAKALSLADTVCVLQNGQALASGSASEVKSSGMIEKAYLS